MKTIQLAVRDFALPVPRLGSIELHSGYGLLKQGQEIHDHVQKLRKKADPNYRSEVKLSHSFERESYKFVVSGRIDGISAEHPLVIEEIKSSSNIHELKAKLELSPDHPYMLQAKTYAYIFYKENAILPDLRLILVSSTNWNQSESLHFKLDLAEFESFLEKRLDELVYEMKCLEADVERRQKLACALSFPFENPRSGQIDLMKAVEDAVKDRKNMLVQAPTGLGKTIAISYPALKNSLIRGQKLVYLTPKNSQHAVAEDAVVQIKQDDLKALTITAKSKICFMPEPVCTPEYCPYAHNYYQKVYENKLIELMAEKPRLNFEVFQEIGEEYKVCPFELQVEAISRADIIIADYNYVFSPRSLLGRITQHNELFGEKPNLVIDEAHNLPDRSCDYYSPLLQESSFREAAASLSTLSAGLSIEAQAVISRSIEIIRGSADLVKNEARINLDPELFKDQERRWKEFLARYLQSGQISQNKDAVLKAANSWSQFCEGIQIDSEHFFSTSRKSYSKNASANNTIELKITCCDASSYLRDTYKEFNSSIAFSATLKPFDYYLTLSGFDPDNTKTIECQSPFPAENRKVILIPQVSTRYKERSRNYQKISQAIEKITRLRPGNYFAFFPSFDFLNEVASLCNETEFEILCQRPEMKAEEIRTWIKRLHSKEDKKALLIFAVQGGVFSEGIDYPGESLIGALIIGPALPKFNLERELLKDYYQRNYNSGFDYAYTYPAMTRVVQSAGRVIRSESDRGLIVLMDQRFIQSNFASAMPQDWFANSVKELVSTSILSDISKFWSSAKL